MDAIVFLVDSVDVVRFGEAKDELDVSSFWFFPSLSLPPRLVLPVPSEAGRPLSHAHNWSICWHRTNGIPLAAFPNSTNAAVAARIAVHATPTALGVF